EASTSRGTTGPEDVGTGSRDARPSSMNSRNPPITSAGSANRHRTSRTPGIVDGSVASSECNVYTASMRPTGSGNSYSTAPLPAGTSRSSPSSNPIAGMSSSSRIVSAEYGTANPASPGSTEPSTMSMDATASSREAASLAMTFDRPGHAPTPTTAGTNPAPHPPPRPDRP